MVGSFPFFSKKGSSSVNPNLLFLYLFFVQSNGQELTSIAWWDRRFPRNREAWMYSRWTTAHIRSRGGNAVYLRVSATARFASSEWGRYVFVKLNWVVICCKMYFVSPCSSCAPGVMCFSVYSYYRKTGVCVCVCVCVTGITGLIFHLKQHLHCTFRFHLRRCFKSLSVKQYGLTRLVWGISVQRRVNANARIIAFYGGGFFKSNI